LIRFGENQNLASPKTFILSPSAMDSAYQKLILWATKLEGFVAVQVGVGNQGWRAGAPGAA